MSLSRRDLIKIAAAGGAAMALPFEHLHGSASLPQYDGYASDITNPGSSRTTTTRTSRTRARSGTTTTASTTPRERLHGPRRAVHPARPVEQALPIPHGRYDVPLVIKDAMFTSNGELIYDDNSESGLYGDVILVNGVPWPKMKVERRKYRFRILNASVSRSYELALSTATRSRDRHRRRPDAARSRCHALPARHGRALRGRHRLREVPIGQRRSSCRTSACRTTSTSTHRQGHGVRRRRATRRRHANNEVPTELNPDNAGHGAARPTRRPVTATPQLEFERKNGSGRQRPDLGRRDQQRLQADARQPEARRRRDLGARATSGGWFHPVHIHLVDFKILDRNGGRRSPYELGPKDVVYVGENETVRVIIEVRAQVGRT
jgi:spore coat protein A